MIETKDIQVELEQLLLDPNNYRLADEKEESKIPDKHVESLQKETLNRLKKQRLGELQDSILNNGFLEMERIVIRILDTDINNKEKDESKIKYVVVEGNRRTAALISIKEQYSETKEKDGRKEIVYSEHLPEELKKKFKKINVQLIEGDEQQIKDFSATLMGVRHVAGPKKWDGFQSAKLINDLYFESRSFTEIGLLLGITNREVGRRFRGYQAFKQMKADENFKSYVESRHYGLFLEFLSSSKSGKEWLKWDDVEYKFKDEAHLRLVYQALTPYDGEKPQIRNPGDARKYVSLLNTPFRVDIEAGKSIHTMPDPDDFKPSGKLKRIISFKSFIERSDFSDDETEELENILNLIQEMLGEN